MNYQFVYRSEKRSCLLKNCVPKRLNNMLFSILLCICLANFSVGVNALHSHKSSSNVGNSPIKSSVCSSKSSHFDNVVPPMQSVWWSNSMHNGSNVQIKSSQENAWWKMSLKDLSPLQHTSNSSQATVFTVIRTGTHTIQLISGGFYITSDSLKLVSKRLTKSPLPSSSVFHILSIKNDEKSKVQFELESKRFISTSNSKENELLLTDSKSSSDVFEVREITHVTSIRGVNIGNWLVMEAWMRPDPFVRVSFLNDGLQFQLQSVYNGHFCGLENSESNQIKCDQKILNGSDVFHLRKVGDGHYQIRTSKNKFWRLSNKNGASIVADDANSHTDVQDKTFQVYFNPDDVAELMFKASNGHFLEVDRTGKFTATSSPSITNPGRGSPSWIKSTSFHSIHSSAIRGEWQISKSLPDAKDVIELHRATWLTEDDFSRMRNDGINTIRIPIGYWIAEHLLQDEPFVTGGIIHLDRAFDLASRFGIRIFLSMHGAPGSQNGFEHSGSRDGLADFGLNSTNVDRHLAAVRWIVSRYAIHSAFLGIGLLNQPIVNGVSLSVLKQFYVDAYHMIRSISPCLFISIQSRVDGDLNELDDFMTEDTYTNVIFETHFYHLFDSYFHNKRPHHFLNHVKSERSKEIEELQRNGRMVLVGEWSLGLPEDSEPKPSDIERFASVQLEIYGRAKAGWVFWSHKIGRLGWSVWSFSESFDEGWIKRESHGKKYF